VSLGTIETWRKEVAGGRNPRDIKVIFAQEIVARFHSSQDAIEALADFEARFKHGALPDEIPEKVIQTENHEIPLVQVLKMTELTASTSEALRMIDQGAVKLDGKKVQDKLTRIARGTSVVLQIGKRKHAKVIIQ
jgi:tyrosyl-tRNA synthetase